jgi:hypothetical protein
MRESWQFVVVFATNTAAVYHATILLSSEKFYLPILSQRLHTLGAGSPRALWASALGGPRPRGHGPGRNGMGPATSLGMCQRFDSSPILSQPQPRCFSPR